MARTTSIPDAGSYNYPALIQAEAPYLDNGSGGNANANVWVTVRGDGPVPLMIGLHNGKFGRGLQLAYKYGQEYAKADHYAVMRYANDAVISAGMRLVLANGGQFRILGAINEDLRFHEIIMPCVEEQAKGSV